MSTYKSLGRFQVESPEWLSARDNRLGGSEIAAVLGISPYESRFSLWHRKKGSVGPQQMNPEMDWGRRHEPTILAKYRESRTGEQIEAGGSYISTERPWQIANPDALRFHEAAVDKVIEIKFSPFGDDWGKAGTGDIPVYYRAQVLWYMDVFGVATADVAVLISGCDYREYTIPFDLSEVQIMRDAAEQFIASLARNERPDIDGHDQTYHAIKELHPEINGDKIDVAPDVAAYFIKARANLQAAEADFHEARNTLADEMGEAKSAHCNGYKIADRRVKGEGRPYLQVANKLPTTEQLRTAS